MTISIRAFSLAALLISSTAAVAQQATTVPPAGNAVEPAQSGGKGPFAACRADLSSLCKDSSGIAGRLQCLKANQDKLSPECIGMIRAILGTVQAQVAAVGSGPKPLKACQQDLASWCPDLKSGDDGRIRCLKDHAPKLSPGCADALKTARTQTRNALQTCLADRARLCSAAGSKAADQIKCLKEKSAELSGECRQFIVDVKSLKAKIGDKAEPAPSPSRQQQPAFVQPAVPAPIPATPTGPPKG